MPRGRKPVSPERLFRFYADHTLSKADVARRLGISQAYLERLVRLHKVPRRPNNPTRPTPDPTPEEIEQRARECRERHYAARRAEPADTVFS